MKKLILPLLLTFGSVANSTQFYRSVKIPVKKASINKVIGKKGSSKRTLPASGYFGLAGSADGF